MDQQTFNKNNSADSSDEAIDYYARVEQSIDHPRLNELRKVARVEAEIDHAEKSKLKINHKRCSISKVKTKRQASNKRSAEICRDAKTIYIKYLEHDLFQEEEDYRLVMQSIFKQTEQTMKIREQIKRIEDANEKKSQQSSWLNNLQPDQPDEIINDLFPGDDEMQDVIDEFSQQSTPEPTAIQPIPSTQISLEEEEEMFIGQLVAQEEKSHKSSLQSTLSESEHHKRGKSQGHSPVSIFETSPEVPLLKGLGPSLHHSHIR